MINVLSESLLYESITIHLCSNCHHLYMNLSLSTYVLPLSAYILPSSAYIPPPSVYILPLSVRGHPSVSLLPLSSPTFYLCICISPPHLCTISKDRTYSRRPLGPMVQRLPRSRLTDSRRLPASLSARTSTASDGLRTHWDRPA
jgi:hypothetical protein